jgi:N-acetylglucosamine-6-sulfatase
VPTLRVLTLGVLLALMTAACSSAGASPTGAGWVSGSPPVATTGSGTGASAPNFVFVLTDDLTWNLVSHMPHVLGLERNGTTFKNYFVTDSLCCPSRTSILTGEFPHDDHVFNNIQPHGGFRGFLTAHDENKTFASSLQARGYQTGLFGKFLNAYRPQTSYEGRPAPYIPPGWSAWDAADTHGYNEYNYNLAVGHQLEHFGSADGDYLTSVLSDKASQFIAGSARAHRPFLAEISTFSPHYPFVPAHRDLGKFPDAQAPRGPAYGHAVRNAPTWLKKIGPLRPLTERHLTRTFRLRLQAVQSVDRMIGRLEAEVRSLGAAKNTYFVFSSDNGLHLGQHDLRQGKETAFDTDIRVPLIVAGPGVPHGASVTQLAENIDLAPTFETLAGATPPPTVDGRSLVAQLRGRAPRGWRTAVLVEHHGPDVAPADPDYPAPRSGNPPSYEAIRTARYLYVEYSNGQREFYNLVTDPYELDNAFSRMPSQLHQRLHDTLLRMEHCHGSVSCWSAQHIRS